MAKKSGFRLEHDSMGELRVPADALWGAQTQRAVQNFPVSGMPMPREFIRALGLIKAAAAEVNGGIRTARQGRGGRDPRCGAGGGRRAAMTRSSRSTCSRPDRAPRAT